MNATNNSGWLRPLPEYEPPIEGRKREPVEDDERDESAAAAAVVISEEEEG